MEEKKFTEVEIKEGAPFAALSYVFFLWILTFIFKKDNAFALYHARQGIVIFIGDVICLTFMFIPIIGVLFGLLALILAVVRVYGILLSLTGKSDKIYVISDLAEKLVV
ncbi:MAG: hypothetical protein PHU64_00145 [Candidatus Omnitrophica bacterium]|nr:hypothetical protein [Candidatus Omnitrophota bacterium]MDD5430419.1 hypothetical protein [Candidatus Omnitrophota bacterium]